MELPQWNRATKTTGDFFVSRELPQAHGLRDASAEAVDGATVFLSRYAVPGLNLAAGFAYFQNDKDSYLAVLRSFVKHTPAKISAAKTASDNDINYNIESYRIAVHSLKGSGRGIGAEDLGKLAERLEKAAVKGEREYIRANNPALVETAERLVFDIAAFLENVSQDESAYLPGEEKPEKERPAPEILREISQACDGYDMAGLRKAAAALDSFRYASAPELAQWVAEQASLSNFDAIQKRMAQLLQF